MHYNQERMKECIELCNSCHNYCEEILFGYCLDKGGKHAEQGHVKLMADCIKICQLTANFLLRDSDMYPLICDACAEICDACADSCDSMDDPQMTRCAETCRRCAEACAEMSSNAQKMAGIAQPSGLGTTHIM